MLVKEKKRVLVVEDDSLICWALKKNFTGLGVSTQVVENSADALSELRRNPYEIVFLDIRLPDGNGIELLPEIRNISPDAQVIVMSGDAGEKNRNRAFAGGALKFLEKPFDLFEAQSILKDALNGTLQKRKHQRSGCSIPLRITIMNPAMEEAAFDLNNLSGTMADFSSGGFRVLTKYPFNVRQSVRAHVADESNHDVRLFPPHADAEVVWVNLAPDSVLAGLKFLNC
jgi:DNA-binding NtrC family response regulator